MATSTDTPRRVGRAVLLGVALLAGVSAASIGALVLPDALAVTGLSDPGPVTTYGLPFLRAAGEIAAIVAIGHFLFAAFLVPPQANGVLDVDGYRALRTGGAACAVWAMCAAVLVALTVSDVSGVPLTDLSPLDIWSATDLVETTSAWRTTAILAAVVAVASLPVLRWSWTPALLLSGLVTLMPLAVTGHSSSGGSHDIATNSLIIHLVAGALWAGGLLALLGHALRGGGHTDIAARRFSRLALWCFAAMAVSGLVNAAVRIDVSDILSSSYGLLVVGKVAALIGLGAIGWRHRRSSIVALQRDPTSRRALLRLALTEAALFGVAVGVAVGLGRTPPPLAPREPLPAEAELGFDLAGPPTIARVFLEWRFDLIFGTAALVMVGIYLAAVYRLARGGASWSKRRTASWVMGCLTLVFATSSGLGMYMAAMFSMHAVVQVILTIGVPVLLVQGAPVTLALTPMRASHSNAVPGPREWLVSALNSSSLGLIARPWTALALLLVGVYGLCFEVIFDAAVSERAPHILMIGYFLLSGVWFFAAVSGVDPVLRPMPTRRRMAILLFAMSQFVLAGVLVTTMRDTLGGAFYRSLKLGWHTNLLGDQRLGGQILAAGGLVAMLAVLAVPIVQRARSAATVRKTGAPSIGS
ncbi:bifunctional copper resistance protein CopD/cytochrome c oxidase assembly protein [Mycolicibacterium lacusdiani]|uniref:bifunctional copper resistance protein CopD/cytochrome c oxidase assembly protein n=1 Tax=Mycolicibacterium lacusdiani TaxID=2895283 RepID=UPI00355636D8